MLVRIELSIAQWHISLDAQHSYSMLPSQASFVWLVTGDRVLEFKRNHHPSRTVRGNASGPVARKIKERFQGVTMIRV